MSANELLDRLLAWEQGGPLPTTESLPFPRVNDSDRLVLAFVRMGGESSPWGVGIGRPDQPPRIFTVPDPRNRDAHAEFVLSFADDILAHVGHPSHLPEYDETKEEQVFPKELLRRRQLWVPGPTHIEMLHLLDFRYTLANTGDEERLRKLRAFGRASGWLFRESTRPGQVRVFDATARLRDVYAFPAEPLRQRHLGFLLAWLGDGDRTTRETRAREAEQGSVGVTMLPAFERDTLEGLVSSLHQTKGGAHEAIAKVIHQVLIPEIEMRWRLTVQAMRTLDTDPRSTNPQLDAVLDLGLDECQWQYFNHELRARRADLTPEERRALGSHPETDFSPVKAASRYFQHLHAHEVAASELVHGDRVLLERALDAGDGFRGTVSGVWRENNATSGPVRWSVRAPADESLRLREESKVCLVGARKRSGEIVSIEPQGEMREIVIEIKDGLTTKSVPGMKAANDTNWIGETVTFIDQGAVGISQRKSIAVRSADGPGAWLTHAAPLPEPSPPGLVRPDLVDFVKGLQ